MVFGANRIDPNAHANVLLRIAAVIHYDDETPPGLSIGESGPEDVLIEIELRYIPPCPGGYDSPPS